jgi:hypothetical protein
MIFFEYFPPPNITPAMLYGIVAHRMGPDKAAGSRLRPWSR